MLLAPKPVPQPIGSPATPSGSGATAKWAPNQRATVVFGEAVWNEISIVTELSLQLFVQTVLGLWVMFEMLKLPPMHAGEQLTKKFRTAGYCREETPSNESDGIGTEALLENRLLQVVLDMNVGKLPH
jgi:hypothetical protein